MTFYDNNEPFSRTGLAELDRVYCFAWDEFTQSHWDTLDAVYRRLPGWIGYDPVPWWFGTDEEKAPHLTASVEPPGLQVIGLLPAADFMAWHDAFMEAAKEFPTGDSI